MSTAHAIGNAIREARDRLRLSPDELATSAHVDVAALAGQEHGDVLLSIAKLERVATVLEIDASALYEGRVVTRTTPSVFFLHRGVPDFFPDDRIFLGTALDAAIALRDASAVLGRAESLRAKFEPLVVGDVPFEDGYHLARRVRLALGNTVDEIGDLRRLLEERFEVAVCVAPFQTQRVLGATVKDNARDAVAVALSSDVRASLVTRVVLAHELAHALFDPAADPIDLVIDREDLDDARASAGERRAKAFAAELLMPRLGLKHWFGEPRALDRPREANQLIDEVRERFRTPAEITVNHLWNQGYFCRDDAFREELVASASQRRGAADRTAMPSLPRSDGRSSLLLTERTREAHDRLLITDGRARELLGLSVYDELPWEQPGDADLPA